MKEFQLNGKVRETFGKKETKMLRKEGLVPCNIYGEKKNADSLPEA
ncbi:MAG: 50S ribosomal protein L25, partial [Prevotella sp.]|nr:50S ribosomal protein L25 [Prevotella sp.]